MNHSEEELRRDLADGAGVFDARGGRERSLAEVLGTARSIRRRRLAGAGLVAAAVLAAIAVPVALGSSNRSAAPPLPASSVTPRPVDRIGLGALPVGPTPASGWVSGTTWHTASGAERPVLRAPAGTDRITGAALAGKALVATVSDAGGSQAVLVRPAGRPIPLGRTSGGLGRSATGGLVAFAGPSGARVTVVGDEGRTIRALPGPGVGEGALQPAAITGTDCTATPPGCVVWLNDLSVGQRVVPVASSPTVDLAGTRRIRTLADVAADGRKAGIVSRTEGGTCSEVQDARGQRRWRTCAARLVAFSPDGRRLLGTSAYGDGLGDTELTVFDAATGGAAIDLRTARNAAITQLAWEDDRHVLAVVLQGRRAAIVRIDVEGRAEYAVPPVPAPDGTSPFVLPAS